MLSPTMSYILQRFDTILAVLVDQVVVVRHWTDLILGSFVEVQWDLGQAVLTHDACLLNTVFYDGFYKDAELSRKYLGMSFFSKLLRTSEVHK